MYRLGSAETGVSMSRPRFESYASRFCELELVGGGGRAKGFGGPAAPADKTADAEGDGGGNTMCELPLPLAAGLAEAAALAAADGEPPPPDSLSDASLGICRLRRGRAEREPDVSERCGGGNSLEVDCGRGG